MFVQVFMGFIKSSLQHSDDINLAVMAAFMSGSSACVDGRRLHVVSTLLYYLTLC